jgi:preprotein translocase subunit Sec61beta
MALPLAEMAAASGLDFYNDPGPHNSKQGVLIGVRNGFFICAGAIGQSSRIGVLARFKGCADTSALTKALKQNPAMKKMYTVWNAQVTSPQTVLWSFGKPMRFKKEDFAAAIEGFAQTIAQFATPFDVSKCEECGAAVQQLVLANGTPTSMCNACQSKAEQLKHVEQQQYDAQDSNLVKALVIGLPAALVAGGLWALLAYWDYDAAKSTYHPKLHVVMGFAIALVVAAAIKIGVGRINVAACVLASVLTAVGKVAGDVLFYSLIIAHGENTPINQQMLTWAALNLWPLKWSFSPLVAIFDIVAVLAAGPICWGMRPKFALTFKTYPMPRSAPKPVAAAAKAGLAGAFANPATR